MGNSTSFKPGNKCYRIRLKDGRDAIYTPEELFEKANDYFLWCDENPMQEETIVKYKDTFDRVDVSKLRPYTIIGFCNFADICTSTFDNYSKKAEYMAIITRIRQIVYNQKFDGAAGGFLKENLMIRDLKLKDTTEITYNNHPKELNPAEVKYLQEHMSQDYGRLPQQTITIDVDHEEVD